MAALIPRGTVYDRRGLPLATGDRNVARRARDEYRKHGVDVPGCANSVEERCYPLGGAAFHLLGDASSRRNWTASNTSYIERDAQDRLRGYEVIATLIPLLRHRYSTDHPDVKALLDRKRDITTTIDAPTSSAGCEHPVEVCGSIGDRTRGRGRAQSRQRATAGHRQLSVPRRKRRAVHGEIGSDPEQLLDRARYGLYPPGSTFKLVTAVAALRRDPASSRATFMCARQPNGRVGVKIPGWSVVRDDVLDTHPHGTIGMHDGIVRSCNAYFAQLAVRVGPKQMLDTATLLGISVARDNSASRLRQTLPQAGYGQGDVVATPLRMARVAGAIASKGILREPTLEHGSDEPAPNQRLLTADAAALLGQYLRDAVLTGTGRSLRQHSWKIAVERPAPQKSAGPSRTRGSQGLRRTVAAEKRIAFAVIIENAGYGGSAAAPAAGEIVSAAAASGLIRVKESWTS